MGLTFRSGEDISFVRFGGRTIKDGEAADIWDRNGVHKEIIGPKRVLLFYSTIRFLTRFKAEASQYLQIKHRDGDFDHVCGPVAIYLNPSRHDGITVKDGIRLKPDEVLVISNTPSEQWASLFTELMSTELMSKRNFVGAISQAN
jgi:hypothetical protein